MCVRSADSAQGRAISVKREKDFTLCANRPMTLFMPYRCGLSNEFTSARLDTLRGRRIRNLTVDGLTIESVWKLHVQPRFPGGIDILVTDLEGFDFAVLRATNFSRLGRLRPRAILYEHGHGREGDSEATLDHLRAHGYLPTRIKGTKMRCPGADTLVVRNS